MQIHNSYYQLGKDFYKPHTPDKLIEPQLIIFNNTLSTELNFDLDQHKNNLAHIFAGNILLPHSKPIALAYAGHQFGHFVPQLGDGRAVLLGDCRDKNNLMQDIQLKGSGRTFFSRNGDGKCPLGAAIREYLVSEAMHYLTIPTTRALAIVKSKEFINREQYQPASVITRIAKSHVRIGTFEYFSARQETHNLKYLADYVINRHFPECQGADNNYLALLQAVIQSQAELVASWMSIGFIHGVMNTDNTAISGQTIDYGPCAFMDEYQSKKVFSFIDKNGRYNFSNQKHIMLWNLSIFAETILPLINSNIKEAVQLAETELAKFHDLFEIAYYHKMAHKIGIVDFQHTQQDKNLIDDFLNILENNQLDFTNSFRALSNILLGKSHMPTLDDKYLDWQQNWQQRLHQQNLDKQYIANHMDKVNPMLIPRNHIIENIINQAVINNDYTEMHLLADAMRTPFVKNSKYKHYYSLPNAEERVINTFCGT